MQRHTILFYYSIITLFAANFYFIFKHYYVGPVQTPDQNGKNIKGNIINFISRNALIYCS